MEYILIKPEDLRQLIKEAVREELDRGKPKKYYTANEVAEILGISYRTVMRQKYSMGGEKIGGQFRFTIDKVNAFINPQKQQ